jgi:hypothetical protein
VKNLLQISTVISLSTTFLFTNAPVTNKIPSSFVKGFSRIITIDGPKLSQALHRELNQYTQLDVALEPYGLFAKTDD